MEQQYDSTLGYRQPTSRNESQHLPAYRDCPACYMHESPLEKRMKPVVKGVEDGVEFVCLPVAYGILFSAFVLSGFRPII